MDEIAGLEIGAFRRAQLANTGSGGHYSTHLLGDDGDEGVAFALGAAFEDKSEIIVLALA